MSSQRRRQTQDTRPPAESRLRTFGHDLSRCRARAYRLWRTYQAIDENAEPAESAAAHKAWSDAVDTTLRIAEAISREQAHDLVELRIQLDSIWWWLVEDDSILDANARR